MIVILSAFSGLAGALVTQLITGIFAYISDKRKQHIDLDKDFRNKKLEIGENFYFVNGELMVMIRKNISYWLNLYQDCSEQTLLFMKKEMEKIDLYQQRLLRENWKFNLISIYFKLPFDREEMENANQKSRQLYWRVNDLSNKIKVCQDAVKLEEYHQKYANAIFDLYRHYEVLYDRMCENNDAIQKQLLKEFATH